MKIILSQEEVLSVKNAKEVILGVLDSEGIGVGSQDIIDDYKGISVSHDHEDNTIIEIEHEMVKDFYSLYQKVGILMIRAAIQVHRAFKKVERICEGFDDKWTRKSRVEPAQLHYAQESMSSVAPVSKRQIGFVMQENSEGVK